MQFARHCGRLRGGGLGEARGQLRLHVAQRHRQGGVGAALDDAEARRKLGQGRIFVGAHGERIAPGIDQRATGVVLQVGGNLELEGRALGKRAGEGDPVDQSLHHLGLVQARLEHAAAGSDQTNPGRRGERHGSAELQTHRQDRNALRLAIHPLAAESGLECRPRLERHDLILGRRDAAGRLDPLAPHQLHLRFRRQGAPALQHRERRVFRIAQPQQSLLVAAGTRQAQDQQPGAAAAGQDGAGVLADEVLARLEDAAPLLALDQSHRDALAHAVHGAVGMLFDALGARGRIEAEDERLILVDALVAFVGQAVADGGTAGMEIEALAGGEGISGKRCDAALEGEAAGDACRQILGEVIGPVAAIHPAAAAGDGAFDVEGRHFPRLAERHHLLGEAGGHLAHLLHFALRRKQFHRFRGSSRDSRASKKGQDQGTEESAMHACSGARNGHRARRAESTGKLAAGQSRRARTACTRASWILDGIRDLSLQAAAMAPASTSCTAARAPSSSSRGA